MRRALLVVALVCSAPVAVRAEDLAWEKQLQASTADQDREIDVAKRSKTMQSVVGRYASRVSRDSTAVNHYLFARALYHNEDLSGAKTQLSAAIEADPNLWQAHLLLAKVLIDLKSPSIAERHLRAVLTRKPGHTDALRLTTNVAMEAKDWARALRILEDLRRASPDDPEVLGHIALVHVERKDWPAAVAALRALQARRQSDEITWNLGYSLEQMKDVDGALVEYERFARARPADPRGWARLYDLHIRRRDWPKAKDALEKLIPLLPEDRRREASKQLEALRSGNPEGVAPPAEAAFTWQDVFAKVQDADVGERQRALQAVLSGIEAEALDRVPREVVAHVVDPPEKDPTCRALVVKIVARLGPERLPLLGVALHDADKRVRMLAAEGIGDVGAVAGIAYLLPRLSATDPDEFESIRSSLARLTEHDDRGPGSPVTRPEEVDASREAWRRWGLSEQSRDPKIRAVRQFVDLPEPLPERYLVEFAGDPTFDVMREGYLALRRVAGRPASDPVSTKMLPLFPRFDDGAVTRPNMRTIQERVGRWWNEWQAERRALIKAGG